MKAIITVEVTVDEESCERLCIDGETAIKKRMSCFPFHGHYLHGFTIANDFPGSIKDAKIINATIIQK